MDLEESVKIDRLKRTAKGRKASFPFIGLEITDDSSSSISLPNGSLLEITQKEGYPANGTPGDRYFAIPQVSVYEGSVALANRIPDGSTFDLPATDTFGQPYSSPPDTPIANIIVASSFTMIEGGRAVSMTVRLLIFNGVHSVKCAIYEYIAEGNVGALVGETEVKSIGISIGPKTFNFTGTKPVLLANKNYYLAVWANKPLGTNDARVATFTVGTTTRISKSLAFGSWPDPMTGEAPHDDQIGGITCTYIPDSKYLFEHWVDWGATDANNWEIVFKTVILNRTGSTQTILYRGKVRRVIKGD